MAETGGDHGELLELARSAAREAGRTILEVYASDFAVRHKSDRSPVTLADEQAEAVIIAALALGAPDIPVIAEEQIAAMKAAPQAAKRFWLVDPLDGTREFVDRNGEFTVNIALVENGAAVLGIVHLPVTGMTFAGSGPGSATRQHAGAAPVAIAVRPAPAEGAIVIHSRSHADEERIAGFIATLTGATRRIMGSSAKFCLVASGEADYYPRFGRTMEWDTAAGQAVLEAAGGQVTALDGAPLRYGKPGYRNPDFMARGAAG